MIRRRGMGNSVGQMEENIWVNGRMGSSLGRVKTLINMVKRLSAMEDKNDYILLLNEKINAAHFLLIKILECENL